MEIIIYTHISTVSIKYEELIGLHQIVFPENLIRGFFKVLS
jgi:hypothetical protein